MFKKYVGDKRFYKRVLYLMLPIMIQNGITNFVSMLDNVMVGRVGTVEMTGVAVANQLMFVFNLCIFGAVSGAGIFGAQFYGDNDREGVRDTFRFKVVFCILLTVLCIGVFAAFGEPLINLYLQGEGSAADAAASLQSGKEYIGVMLIGLLPYTLVQCYSSTLRETGETLLPMYAGVAAVGVNLCLNYVLIFGHFGAPAMGVTGAAIATVVSRFAELVIITLRTWQKRDRFTFITDAFRSLRVPARLVRQIMIQGLPLMINEALWAAGIAVLNQNYSYLGLDVVPSINILQTFSNVFSVAFMAVGASIGIILGQMLGSGETDGAQDTSRKLIAFSLFVSAVASVAFFAAAPFIPEIYNTTSAVRETATRLMQICALTMPLDAFANASYFTLRSGGKVMVTFLFDSCFVLCVSVPAAFLLSHFTSLDILAVYGICQCLNFLKCVVGYCLVKKGIWIQNIVGEKEGTV